MIKSYLKRIFSIISLLFCTNSYISAKRFIKDNNEFLEVVLLDECSIDIYGDFNSVMLYGDPVNNNVTNSLEYDGKKYSLNANEKINKENKIVVNGVVFLEIQNLNSQNANKDWIDVVMYDIPELDNVSKLNEKYGIVRNFIHEEKLYRIRAIDKDFWDKYLQEHLSSILDNLYLINSYIDGINENRRTA